MTTRREKVEEAKEIITTGVNHLSNELITAKLVVKFGGKTKDYVGIVKQAKKELEYAAIAKKAFAEHLQEMGSWHRNINNFAELVQMGSAKPECPFPALRNEAQSILAKWNQEVKNIEGKDWRARVNLAKDAIENRDDPAEILRVAYSADNPMLRQKVVAVANRELKNDNYQLTMANVHVGTKNISGSGRKKKKNKKAKKLATCQQNAKKIFGLRRVV